MTQHSANWMQLILPSALFALLATVTYSLPGHRDYLLPLLFLLLPYLDRKWHAPRLFPNTRLAALWLVSMLAIAALLLAYPRTLMPFLRILLLAALPEEWFFRGYLQKRYGNGTVAILIVSLMFSLLHFLTRDIEAALLVFVPSVTFGWLYQKTGDLLLIVLVHALSNLVYFIYLQEFFTELLRQT